MPATKAVSSSTPLVLVLPIVGLVGGIVLGLTAPLRRGAVPVAPPE